MKRINKAQVYVAIIAVSLLAVWSSCSHENEFVKMISTDLTKPEPITDYHIVNFNGGAHIIYELPKVDNILYVEADYDLSGGDDRPIQSRSSYFADTITVEGFEVAGSYDVTLRVVSRADVASDPVTIQVHPETPPYQLVAEHLALEPDFQGVRIRSYNETERNVGIVLLDDVAGDFSIRQQNFSALANVSYTVRGYDTTARVFGAYVTDQWGNRSDTVYQEVRPLYETELDKSKFFHYELAGETPSTGFPFTRIWNGIYSGNVEIWRTINPPGDIVMPVYGTFGLGSAVKLSRFRMFPRNPGWEYQNASPSVFSFWGSDKDNPSDFVVPLQAELGTRIGDWVNLGTFTFPLPPSGASFSTLTAEDKAFFNAGAEFDVSFDAPRVKYLRFVVNETWSGVNFAHIAEIDLFGDDRQ